MSLILSSNTSNGRIELDDYGMFEYSATQGQD